MRYLQDFPWLISISFLAFSCLTNKINLEKFISFASVYFYIQIVPLCDYNNNIRKQVHMAFEHGLFNK